MQKTSSFNSVYNFIVNFKPEEIDEVIIDFETRNKGISMLYALDPYDVIAHYLPYTEDSFFRNSNKNALAQKLICYDHFFDFPNRNVLILDEYTIELLSVKNRIQRQLKDSSLIFKNLEDLKKSTAKFTEHGSEANDFLGKNFELILLLLILNEKKDFIHKEFDDFLKNKLTILNIETGSAENDKVIDEVFATTQHSELSTILFKAFVEDNKFELLEYDNPEERYIYLENTFRDIQAIDRILLVNQRLVKDTSFILMYLSSTPKKTNKIFRSLKRLTNQKVFTQTTISTHNIHRNIFQCFLLDILEAEFSNDRESIKPALESLKKLATKFAKNEKLHETSDIEVEASDMPTLHRLKKLFDFYSSKLDNHFYIKIYEKYKNLYQTFQPSVKNKHTPQLKTSSAHDVNVLEIFDTIDKFLNQENFKRKLFDFTNTVSQLQQALDITNILMSPNVNFGKDVIKNNFHHLPYLVFYDLTEKPKLINRLHEFLNVLINIPNPNHALLKGLSEFLKPVINELTDDIKKINLLSLQQIVISYINLVTLPASKKSISIKEEEIIESLEKQKAIFNSLIFDSSLEKENNKSNLNINFRKNVYAKEIDYILLWLYRRNNKIENGITIGKELVKNDPDDPRFYHGLALCYISDAYKAIFHVDPLLKDNITAINNLNFALLYLKRAKELYEILLNKCVDALVAQLVQKNFVAVLNSLSDISIRKYDLSLEKSYANIEEARHYFETLKRMCSEVNIVYLDSDTFIGTELELFYFEALESFSKNNLGDAHLKIIQAQANSSLLDKRKSDSITHPMFRLIQLSVNELFKKIIEQISK